MPSLVQRELTTLGFFCKHRHVRQAKGGTGASSGTHPTLETNKQTKRHCLTNVSLCFIYKDFDSLFFFFSLSLQFFLFLFSFLLHVYMYSFVYHTTHFICIFIQHSSYSRENKWHNLESLNLKAFQFKKEPFWIYHLQSAH